MVQKKFLDGKAKAVFCNILRSFESHSSDFSLSDTVENFNTALSFVVNTFAALKVKKRTPRLNNNSVNEVKITCRPDECLNNKQTNKRKPH